MRASTVSFLQTDPESAALDPASVVIDPESVAIDPESVAIDPESVVIDPESVVIDPESVVIDPGSVVIDPESVVIDSESVAIDSESSAFDAGSTGVADRSWVSVSRAFAVRPECTCAAHRNLFPRVACTAGSPHRGPPHRTSHRYGVITVHRGRCGCTAPGLYPMTRHRAHR
jgi:hypothetical protein